MACHKRDTYQTEQRTYVLFTLVIKEMFLAETFPSF